MNGDVNGGVVKTLHAGESTEVNRSLSFQALKMMMGLDLVSIQHRNLTLNNLHVPNGEPRFQNGTVASADDPSASQPELIPTSKKREPRPDEPITQSTTMNPIFIQVEYV